MNYDRQYKNKQTLLINIFIYIYCILTCVIALISPPEQNALSPAPLIITSFTPSSCIHQNSSNHFISSILGILAQGGENKKCV